LDLGDLSPSFVAPIVDYVVHLFIVLRCCCDVVSYVDDCPLFDSLFIGDVVFVVDFRSRFPSLICCSFFAVVRTLRCCSALLLFVASDSVVRVPTFVVIRCVRWLTVVVVLHFGLI
jgi:hypothetical protein